MTPAGDVRGHSLETYTSTAAQGEIYSLIEKKSVLKRMKEQTAELSDEAKQEQEKDSHNITIERVELIKSFKDEKSILLVYACLRNNA